MTVAPGHYLEQAVDYFLAVEPQLRDALPQESGCFDHFKWLFPIALRAPRFFLPHDGIVGTGDKSDLAKLVTPIRIPYPTIVIEFSVAWGRIIHIVYESLSEEQEPITNVYTVRSWNDNNRHAWEPGHKLIAFRTAENPFAMPTAHTYGIRGDVVDLNTGQSGGDADPGGTEAHGAWAVLFLILALQCCNVQLETIPAPVALNKKRLAHGKLPFVEYKILTVAGRQTAFTGEGTHASPRQHIRRGHIRRISDNRTVWVNQCLVGNPNKGFIVKDYRVTA